MLPQGAQSQPGNTSYLLLHCYGIQTIYRHINAILKNNYHKLGSGRLEAPRWGGGSAFPQIFEEKPRS